MFLLSAFPVAPFVILGDVAADVPVSTATLPHWLQVVMMVLGAVVPIASGIAMGLNAYIRTATARGERVPTWLLAVAAGVNVPALNVDKTAQAVTAIKEQVPESKS